MTGAQTFRQSLSRCTPKYFIEIKTGKCSVDTFLHLNAIYESILVNVSRKHVGNFVLDAVNVDVNMSENNLVR